MVADHDETALRDVVYCTALYYDVEWRPDLVDIRVALLEPEPPILPLAPLEELIPPPFPFVAPTSAPAPAPVAQTPPPPPPLPVALTPSPAPAPAPVPPVAQTLPAPEPVLIPAAPPPLVAPAPPSPTSTLSIPPPPPPPNFRFVNDQSEKILRTKRSGKEIDGHPSHLPVDWTIKKRTRKDGRTDTYYYRPEGGYLRSRKAVNAYLSGQAVKVCKERKGKGKKKAE